MGWIFPTDVISISARITYGSAWNDINLGTYDDVPAGTKAVILRITNDSASNYYANVRPNGNTAETLYPYLTARFQMYAAVKLDSSRIFEGYFNNSNVHVAVVAYTSLDYFSQTATDKSTVTAGSYQTVDCSGQAPSGATAAWFKMYCNSSVVYSHALRKYGTSFDYYSKFGGTTRVGLGFAGLDSSRRAEQKIEDATYNDLYYWGYALNDVIAIDSPTEKSPTTTSSWEDIDVSALVPSGALGVVLDANNTSSTTYKLGLRKKGSSEDLQNIRIRGTSHIFAVVGLDGDGIFQAYIDNTAIDFYVVGYFMPTVNVSSVSGTLASSGSIAKKGKKTVAGALAQTGALARKGKKALVGALASAGELATEFIPGAVGELFYQAVAGTLALAGTVAKGTKRGLAGALVLAGALARKALKSLAGPLAFSGSLVRLTKRILVGVLASIGSLATMFIPAAGELFYQSVEGTLALTGTISRGIKKVLAGTLTMVGSGIGSLISGFIDDYVLRRRRRR